MGKRGNVEINNSSQVGIEPGASRTLPNELKASKGISIFNAKLRYY